MQKPPSSTFTALLVICLSMVFCQCGCNNNRIAKSKSNPAQELTTELALAKLEQDFTSNNVIVVIQNKGKEAQKVTLAYTNVSGNEADKEVYLDGSREDKTEVGNIQAGKSEEIRLSIKWRGRGLADFKFEVQGGKKPITQTLQIVSLDQIKLVSQGPTFLSGNDPSFTFKIEQANQLPIDFSKLSLEIQESTNSGARFIYKDQEDTQLLDIQPEAIETLVSCKINPNSASQATVKITLKYSNVKLPSELVYYWSAHKDLFEGIETNKLDALKQWLDSADSGNGFDNAYKDQLLNLALEKGNVEAVKALLEKGANPNNKDEIGYTPLHKTTDIEMMKLLVEKGANVKIKGDGRVYPPLDYVVGESHNLPSSYAGISIDKRVEIGRFLLDNGAALNRDNNIVGYSPLQVAAGAGLPEIVKLLLDRGADINRQMSFNGETVLMAAVWGKDLETIKLLLDKKGLNLNAQDIYGHTALHYAVKEGNVPMVKLLLEHGADVNVKENGRLGTWNSPIDYVNSSRFAEKVSEGKISQADYDEIKKMLTS